MTNLIVEQHHGRTYVFMTDPDFAQKTVLCRFPDNVVPAWVSDLDTFADGKTYEEVVIEMVRLQNP